MGGWLKNMTKQSIDQNGRIPVTLHIEIWLSPHGNTYYFRHDLLLSGSHNLVFHREPSKQHLTQETNKYINLFISEFILSLFISNVGKKC